MNGVLIVNKPKGFTSHDVVNVLRKKLNIKKIGHTGTLDPNATGVLPILVGQATKISKYLIEHEKEYIAELKLGEKSSTGDTEGEIIEKKDIPNLRIEQIEEVLKTFKGKQKQIPPKYSAIKVNGKKAYEYARNNENIELTPRIIDILEMELLEYTHQIIKFRVICSKGTYIRVLCEDIATKLGTVGLMQNLCRTKVNEFDLDSSIELQDIKNEDLSYIKNQIIPIERVFMNNKKIVLDKKEEKLFINGVKIEINLPDGTYRIYLNKKFLGLGIVENKQLKRDVVMPLGT